MPGSEAFRTCPHCRVDGVPKLIILPRMRPGSPSTWQCRSCGRAWSDTQTLALST